MNIEIEIGAPGRNDREALRAIWQEAFGDSDEFLDLFEQTAYSPARMRRLTVDGQCAAALYWFDCVCEGQKIAYLYAIATAKTQRGKGLCQRLMEDTHAHLKRLGYAAAMLVPSEESLFGFYERLGYRTATKVREFSCEAGEVPSTLVRINEEEYAKIRRKMLPKGAVKQEGDNLTYLAAQSELYRGEGILLALRREGKNIFCTELLGDADAAPSVLCALGANAGFFRTVGEERDFSMIFPLSDKKTPIPTYFGLAFD